jgi:hypothetical protein
MPLFVQVCAAQVQEAKGCHDSPLISHFPGSAITECKDKTDYSLTFTLDHASSIDLMDRDSHDLCNKT